MKVKLRSSDHSSTNCKHACAEGSVTNLKRCYGESADNFWLTYVFRLSMVRHESANLPHLLLFLKTLRITSFGLVRYAIDLRQLWILNTSHSVEFFWWGISSLKSLYRHKTRQTQNIVYTSSGIRNHGPVCKSSNWLCYLDREVNVIGFLHSQIIIFRSDTVNMFCTNFLSGIWAPIFYVRIWCASDNNSNCFHATCTHCTY
jgi:hypothetical protein